MYTEMMDRNPETPEAIYPPCKFGYEKKGWVIFVILFSSALAAFFVSIDAYLGKCSFLYVPIAAVGGALFGWIIVSFAITTGLYNRVIFYKDRLTVVPMRPKNFPLIKFRRTPFPLTDIEYKDITKIVGRDVGYGEYSITIITPSSSFTFSIWSHYKEILRELRRRIPNAIHEFHDIDVT